MVSYFIVAFVVVALVVGWKFFGGSHKKDVAPTIPKPVPMAKPSKRVKPATTEEPEVVGAHSTFSYNDFEKSGNTLSHPAKAGKWVIGTAFGGKSPNRATLVAWMRQQMRDPSITSNVSGEKVVTELAKCVAYAVTGQVAGEAPSKAYAAYADAINNWRSYPKKPE